MKKIYYDVEKCLGCKSCEVYCAVGKSESKQLFRAVFEEARAYPCVDVKQAGKNSFPIACRHCQDHPCVDACIAGALCFDAKAGIVQHNKDKCVGCWLCIMVCPYGAIRQNSKLKIPVRCDLCQDEQAPRCVEACPTGAIIFVEEEEVSKLKEKKKGKK
ncbi:MAG: 4Fe-4S dicluster domain-containing protein [Candidatus Omnitrophica bacterium]|nr:4Fe-4S dicluster domain-containing protein [Candidatus Omnitrophota bacterium]